MTRTAHYYQENGKHYVHLRIDALSCGVRIPVADEAAAEALARANAAGLRRGKPSPITAQLDRERGEFEQWAASTRKEVTVGEYNFGRDSYLEGRRAERALHARLRVIREQPATPAPEVDNAQYMHDWIGRN
jgi:hypothetical protein